MHPLDAVSIPSTGNPNAPRDLSGTELPHAEWPDSGEYRDPIEIFDNDSETQFFGTGESFNFDCQEDQFRSYMEECLRTYLDTRGQNGTQDHSLDLDHMYWLLLQPKSVIFDIFVPHICLQYIISFL